jgi:SAM-dependent methyltransferase
MPVGPEKPLSAGQSGCADPTAGIRSKTCRLLTHYQIVLSLYEAGVQPAIFMQIHHEPLSDIVRYIENNRDIDLKEKELHFDNLLRYLRPFRPIDASLNILEVGTGMGWSPIIAKKRGLRWRGLEISPMLIEAAREYGQRHGVDPDIVLGNIEDYDIGEDVYDVIIANSVFEHIQLWRVALKRMYRALKPGGLLFFESTNKWSLTSGEYPIPCYGWMPDPMRYWFRRKVQGSDIMENGIDFNQFTYVGLRRAFREVGFSKLYDRVALMSAEDVRNPVKLRVLRACKQNAIIRELVLTFFEMTTFVCVK